MKRYITIDGGTTNTRISLVCDGEIVETQRISLGARSGIEDKSALKNQIRAGISKLLDDWSLKSGDIEKILASGMITSEFGLYELPHISAPAGIAELNASMKEVAIPEVSDIPFVFVAGVKIDSDSLAEADIMRGEETELIGIADSVYSNYVYILPGSHSKIIKVDDQGKINGIHTMLTGEMIYSVSKQTILKDAVDLAVEETDLEYLKMGYDYSLEYGINEALFKVRILSRVFKCNKVQLYSFFIGSILQGEIKRIIDINPEGAVVGGKEQIKDAICQLLACKTDMNIIKISAETVSKSSAVGIVKIYEYDKK